MFPNQFEYHRPNSVQAAAGLLAADPEAKLLAGGHSLLPAMKLRLASPSSLVDLGGVDGLDQHRRLGAGQIRRDDDVRGDPRLARA